MVYINILRTILYIIFHAVLRSGNKFVMFISSRNGVKTSISGYCQPAVHCGQGHVRTWSVDTSTVVAQLFTLLTEVLRVDLALV